MVSLKQLKIFVEYNGDSEGWTGCKLVDDTVITQTEWSKMDDLAQDFAIIENGYASVNFKTEFDSKLKEQFEDDETTTFFLSLLK